MENQNQVTVTKSEELQLLEARANAEFALTAAGQMVKTFEITQRIGSMYAKSTIVPERYQNNVANCAIAVDVAMHLGNGLSPLTVMQNLVIIQGTPTWAAKFLISCINASGRFTPIRYKERNLGKVGTVGVNQYVYENGKKTQKIVMTDKYKDVDNIECIAVATDKATGEELEGSPITIKTAMAEGWYDKQNSKWQSIPQQMLKYRAASFWQRAYAPEIGMGFHTTEEIQDEAPIGSSITELKDMEETAGMSLAEEAMQFAQGKKKRNKAENAPEQPISPETDNITAEGEKAPQSASGEATEPNTNINPKAERTLL